MNWWTCFQGRNGDSAVAHGLADTVGEGECGTNEETASTYPHCRVWDGWLVSSCFIAQGAQSDALWWLRWMGWGEENEGGRRCMYNCDWFALSNGRNLAGREDTLEKGIATHSNIFAWRIPRTEEPGGLQSMGSQRVGYNWETNTLSSWQKLIQHCKKKERKILLNLSKNKTKKKKKLHATCS